jgi:hypothetical protein
VERYSPDSPPDPLEWLALPESERIELVRDYHRRARAKLPNAGLHASFHVVVENQAALGDELPVRRTLERLQREGLGRHDAIHAVASVLVTQMRELLQPEARAADPTPEYEAALERLNAKDWGAGN